MRSRNYDALNACGYVNRHMELTGRVERYLEQLKHAKIKGYLFQQQNYYEGQERGG